MTEIVQQMVDEIVNTYADDENVLSLTPVGTLADVEGELDAVNDIDIVCVVKELRPQDVRKMRKFGEVLENKFSSDEVGVTFTMKIGPVKLKETKEKNIMIHFLLYSEKAYKHMETNPAKASFQKNAPLLGYNLSDISSADEITQDDLMNKLDGMQAMKQWMLNGAADCIEPTEDGFELKTRLFIGDEYLDLVTYVILKLSGNVLRYMGEAPLSEAEVVQEFQSRIPISLNDFPERILRLKRRIRNRDFVSAEETKELQDTSMQFIQQCESFVNNEMEQDRKVQ